MPANDKWTVHHIEDYRQAAGLGTVPARLKSGGGGGTSDGIEPRVAKLEASVEHIQKDIAEIKIDMREFRTGIGALNVSTGTLTERVSHLPSKGFVVVALLAALAVIAALIAFQGSIQNLFKLSH
jgi:hypothetical protein